MPRQTTNRSLDSNTPQPLGDYSEREVTSGQDAHIDTASTVLVRAGKYVTVKQCTGSVEGTSFVINAGSNLKEELIRRTNAKLSQKGLIDQSVMVVSTKTK